MVHSTNFSGSGYSPTKVAKLPVLSRAIFKRPQKFQLFKPCLLTNGKLCNVTHTLFVTINMVK